MFAFIGVFGHLTRRGAKHVKGELYLHLGNTRIVGSLVHAVMHTTDGRDINGTLYDVRTALSADEVSNQDMLRQRRLASEVVDYTLRAAKATPAG